MEAARFERRSLSPSDETFAWLVVMLMRGFLSGGKDEVVFWDQPWKGDGRFGVINFDKFDVVFAE